MKLLVKLALVAFLSVFATQTASAQFLKNLIEKSTSNEAVESKTDAYKSGQTSGAALRTLYSQYKKDGKKLNMKNVQNMMTLTSLATNVQGLKDSNSDYKKDFAKGLIIGSTELVNEKNSTSVVSTLADLAKMDLSVLTSGGESKDTQETEKDKTDIASSITSILSLFK